MGTAFGLHLFAETAKAVCAEVDEKRANSFEPDLAWNVPQILARFSRAARQITMVHAVARCDLNEAGYAHWVSARAAFGGEIVKLVGGLLVDAAARLERADELDEWLVDLGDVVIAFVFPDWHGKAKSEHWKARQIEHFDSIRLALRERQGWLN